MPRKRFVRTRARAHAERFFEELAGIAERTIEIIAQHLRLGRLAVDVHVHALRHDRSRRT